MGGCSARSLAAATVTLLVLFLAEPCSAKTVQGSLALQAKQARVVTKFVFDFSPGCEEHSCPSNRVPGLMQYDVYNFRSPQTSALVNPKNDSGLFVALLDDEYFSFSKVSRVWDELSCQEVNAAAKKADPINWALASTSTGDHLKVTVHQQIRPRWWYIAFVSCADYPLEASYRIHLQNLLQGYQHEFSMDTVGVLPATVCLCLAFGYLFYEQISSLNAWRAQSHSRRFLQLHPALLLLTASSCFALLGEICWAKYYFHYAQSGESLSSWSFLGQASIVAGKSTISLLLLLFAHGECVCTPDIAWIERREIVWGLALFSVLSFCLELWGESELRSTTVEYVYDTQAGIALVAFDLLLFWLYASRAWRTVQQETRAKPKVFYVSLGPVLSLWFAALPIVAAVASILAPWVRFRITFFAHSLVHVIALWILIYSFRPAMASRFYELQSSERKSLRREVFREELEHM